MRIFACVLLRFRSMDALLPVKKYTVQACLYFLVQIIPYLCTCNNNCCLFEEENL